MKKYAALVLWVLLMSLYLLACSKQLSESEAKSMLERKHNQMVTILIEKSLMVNYGKDDSSLSPINPNRKKNLEALHTAGYILVNERKEDSGHFTHIFLDVMLSERIIPFIIGQDDKSYRLGVAKVLVDEIKEIKPAKDGIVRVKYTTSLMPNELGKILRDEIGVTLGIKEWEGKKDTKIANFRYIDGRWSLWSVDIGGSFVR